MTLRQGDGGPEGTATEKSATPEPSDGATADESSDDGQVGQSDDDQWPDNLIEKHRQVLISSGINAATARARGYETIKDPRRLALFAKAGQRTMGILIPLHTFDGSVWGYQYRPDSPRVKNAKPLKYETPTGQTNQMDIPVGLGRKLGDTAVPLWITEGSRKADAAAQRGLCCVALLGVWGWMHTVPGTKDKLPIPELREIPMNGRDVILAYDSDVMRKKAVRKALLALADNLTGKGANVRYLHLADDENGNKIGLDDYLVAHGVEELMALVRPDPPVATDDAGRGDQRPEPPKQRPVPIAPVALDELHGACRKWLGEHYDLDAIDAALSVAVVERHLDGDPVWLLIVSGSGATKTETVIMLRDDYDATVREASSISSIGALISASSLKERAADATGGILKELEPRGLLILKDVTSILSMPPQMRDQVLGALREVYDGSYVRDAGVDGGRKIPWTGRIAIIGAVTSAWDRAHAVISRMGDRFVLLRLDSRNHRIDTGRRAIGNTGSESQMRDELNRLALGVLKKAETGPDVELTDAEENAILAAADLVTLARTAVETDYRGDVIDANDPEMPTRFAKQLTQVFRGAVRIGLNRDAAMRLAIRCARDSMPPLRLQIVRDLATTRTPRRPTFASACTSRATPPTGSCRPYTCSGW